MENWRKKADKANESGGFAGGQDAKAEDSAGAAIDAIQLGTGTNSTAKTLQVYDYQLLDADGNIPAERLSNAPGEGGGSVPVVDNLTSTSKISALSANQGRVLDEKKADNTHKHTKEDITDFPTSMTPTSHASTGTTYGVGTASNYGHVKLANNLTTTTTGSALDARQGKTLQDSKLEASNILAGDNIDVSVSGRNVTISAAAGGQFYSGQLEVAKNYTTATTYTNTIPVPTEMNYACVIIREAGSSGTDPFSSVTCYINNQIDDVIVQGMVQKSGGSATYNRAWSYKKIGFITGKNSSYSFGARALGTSNWTYLDKIELTENAIVMNINVSNNNGTDKYVVDWMVWK